MNGIPILAVIVIVIIYFYVKMLSKRKDTPEQNQDTSPQVNRQEPLKMGTSNPTTQTAWISTADELPEYYKTVVLFTADKEILHDYARVNDGREDFYIHPKDPRTLVPNEVTHWMSLGTPTP